MEQFKFKCPQCGQQVNADDSLCGLVVACPNCEKGIVVPHKAKRPILAPISHVQTESQETDYMMRAIERRIGKPISEQSITEKKEVGNTRQSLIVDMLKMIGLIIVFSMVAFDILSVRGQNKTLRKSMETQKAEMEHKLNSATSKANNYEQMSKNAEKFTEDVRVKAKERERELSERITKMEEARGRELEYQRNQMDKLRMSFEDKMRKMQEDFNRQKEHLQTELRLAREAHAFAQKKEAPESLKERTNDGEGDQQTPSEQSIAEVKSRIKANLEEIKSLRMANPGCILVNSAKQARILETKYRPNGMGKYMIKSQITYVRDMFHCTACNYDGLNGPCCNVSRKRSFNLWQNAVHDAQKTEHINARIDELLKENETLTKSMR